jgi:hypothetical protein
MALSIDDLYSAQASHYFVAPDAATAAWACGRRRGTPQKGVSMSTEAPISMPRATPERSGEPIAVDMRRSGIDRRILLRWSAYMPGVLALPWSPYATRIAEAAETQPRLPRLWLNGQGTQSHAQQQGCAAT